MVVVVMMYRAETADMWMRWMWGVMDRIRNERIRGTSKLGEISKKVQESRLKWHRHVMRMDEEYVGDQMVMDVEGRRRKGKPKWR